jgi:glutaredoxin-related protein
MNPDWLNERLSENENLIAHVRRGENEVVLTASTKALQEFVRKHDSEAFGDVSKLQRIGKPGK